MLTKAEIAALKRLQDEGHRRERGAFVVEGDKAVREFEGRPGFALELYATPDWAGWRRGAAPGEATVREITPEEMRRISHFPSPPTVFAVVRAAASPLDPAALRRGLTLALDRVQDPGNVGTIIRIADWFGIARVLLSAGCADAYAQKVVNAAKGSLARVAVHSVDLPAVLADAGVPLFACDADGEPVHGLAAPRDAVLVIGSEGRGLSPAIRALRPRLVGIPAYGAAESLNAAVAAAIVCDNWRRLAR